MIMICENYLKPTNEIVSPRHNLVCSFSSLPPRDYDEIAPGGLTLYTHEPLSRTYVRS